MAETQRMLTLKADIEEDNVQHVPIIEVVNPQKEYPIGRVVDVIINARCVEGCDLGGSVILIGDADNQVVAEQTLTSFADGQGYNTTGRLDVQIPMEPGNYTWTIIFYPFESNSEDATVIPIKSYEENGDISGETQIAVHSIVQTNYSFQAVQHLVGMTAWRNDSHLPVPVGDNYLLNIGVQCLHGCSLLEEKVSISHNGVVLAIAEMGIPVAPLDDLYQAKVLLTAPDEVDKFTLECRLEPKDLDSLHISSACKHILTTSKHAQCRLDLLALSKEDGTPVEAEFIVQPKGSCSVYARADQNGKTSIGMPWGDIQIEAHCNDYGSVQTETTIPEGQEVYELSVVMPWQPHPLD